MKQETKDIPNDNEMLMKNQNYITAPTTIHTNSDEEDSSDVDLTPTPKKRPYVAPDFPPEPSTSKSLSTSKVYLSHLNSNNKSPTQEIGL